MLHTQADRTTESIDRHGSCPLSPQGIRASITVLKKTGDGRKIKLDRPVTIFGSHKEAQVRLKHESIARAHCAIINTGLRLVLRDLGSKTGIRVNGKKTQNADLKNGDTIRIDAWKFRVNLKSNGDTCSGSSIAATVFMTHPEISLEEPASGNTWSKLDEIFVVGRRTSCEVHIDNNNISRAHALVCCLNGRPAIFDLVSSNGLSVNGASTKMTYLSAGDEVALGEVVLRVTDVRGASGVQACQESCYAFGDSAAAADRIKLADAGGQGTSASFVRYGGFEPQIAPNDRFAADLARANGVDPVARVQDSETADRQKELAKRSTEIEAQQADLETRELELGDREHQLRTDARKLADTHNAKLADMTAKAREEIADQHAHIEQQKKTLDERRNELQAQDDELTGREAAVAEASRELNIRETDIEARRAEVDALQSRSAESDAATAHAAEELQFERELLKSDRAALYEREAELTNQRDEISRLHRECDARAAELEAATAALERERAEHRTRVAEIEARAEQIAVQAEAVDTQRASLKTRESALTKRIESIELKESDIVLHEQSLNERSAELDRRADALVARTAALTEAETALQADAERLALHDREINERFAEIEAREEGVSEQRHRLENQARELERTEKERAARFDQLRIEINSRNGELERLTVDLNKRQQTLAQGEDALAQLERDLDNRISAHSEEADRRTRMTDELVKLETELTARRAVVEDLTQALEKRAAELDTRDKRLSSREPVLNELAKSLEHRAAELDTRQREIADAQADVERLQIEAQQTLETAMRETEHNAGGDGAGSETVMSADPLQVDDDRASEILRLLDPALGDSIRVLRRLGVEGSFDELIALAQQELLKNRNKPRARWNPFR